MNTGKFPESNIEIAKGQEEYNSIEAHYDESRASLVYCVELSLEEKRVVMETGRIWVEQLTGGGPMQPIFFTANKKDVL